MSVLRAGETYPFKAPLICETIASLTEPINKDLKSSANSAITFPWMERLILSFGKLTLLLINLTDGTTLPSAKV